MSTADTLRAQLDRFGFDDERWRAHRAMLAKRPFSPELSLINEPVVALSAADFARLPEKDSAPWRILAERGEAALRAKETAVVLLNGGMATRFGGIAKGCAPALGQRSFLDLRMRQVQRVATHIGARVPVLLMNSFATHEATLLHLQTHDFFGLDKDDIAFAPQGISLRLTESGNMFTTDDGVPSPYAPGHGDLPWALARSGAGDALRARGVKTLFVSNVDNLGCTLDPALIGAHLAAEKPMTVELTDRLAGDTGGAPARVGGRIQLVEGFRMPASFPPERLIGFNTNTFYLDWSALDLRHELPFYPIAKQVGGASAIQFERILGELSRHVETQLLLVPRDLEHGRFLPVKTPEDLQALQPALASRYG